MLLVTVELEINLINVTIYSQLQLFSFRRKSITVIVLIIELRSLELENCQPEISCQINDGYLNDFLLHEMQIQYVITYCFLHTVRLVILVITLD